MAEPIEVIVAGLPGNMATLVARQVAAAPDMKLIELGLSKRAGITRAGKYTVLQVMRRYYREVLGKHPEAIVVDFTAPKAVNRNAQLYVRTGHPFVMGTTGGDREALISTVRGSNVSAVIDVNMGVPLVVLKAMVEWASKQFPGALNGYRLSITEDHQANKLDTSGTALAFKDLFSRLGAKLTGKIKSIRDLEEGHGYHWFTLRSPDGTVVIELNTKVEGRLVYALGTLAAIRFLHQRVQEGSVGEVFTMTDVISARKEA